MALDELVDCKTTFHPNRISAYSLAVTAGGIGLMAGGPATDIAGLGLVTAGYLLDNVDGRVARRWKLQTEQGSRLDSLIDKIKTISVGTYILTAGQLTQETLFPAMMLTNFCLDAYSFTTRGNVGQQLKESYNAVINPELCTPEVRGVNGHIKANMWGKVKAAIQYSVGVAYLGLEVARNHQINMPEEITNYAPTTLGVALGISAVLGSIGIVKRIKKKD